MGSRLTAVLASSFICLLAFASSAQAAFPGANGKLAFADGNGNVATINPDGTGQTRLAAGYGDPAWSADGRKIAYINDVGHLATMNADGSGQTDLGFGARFGGYGVYSGIGDPAWSPDGGQIAYDEWVDYPDGTYYTYLWIVNADGTGRHEVPPGGAEPSWSPDGQWIAYSGYCNYPTTEFLAICKVHPDGTGTTTVFAREDGDVLSPDWSPDGTQIVFTVAYRSALEGSIWKVGADGSGAGVVRADDPSYRPDAYWYGAPAWSPNQTKIVVARTSCSPTFQCAHDLYTMNSDGSGETRLTPGGAPSWQPLPNRAPDCSGVAASRPVLTTANHRLVPITLDGATDPDGDPVTLSVDGVTQDEPVVSRTDNTSPDAVDQGDGQLRVRAERNPHGDGRVYRIAFTASDGRGGSCSGTARVSVPRKKRKPAVDSAPPSYDSFGR
jgi:Tol biopolymer transport system component